MKISVDRLTVCGNLFGDLEGFYSRTAEIEKKGFAKYPYRDSIHFQDGSVLQIAEVESVRSGKIKELRYDFNPNKKKYEKLHMSVIRMMKEIHLTRADIAFDVYDVDMSRWKWIDSKGRPYNVYYSGDNKIETWYVGGKDSETRIRIYNKAKERKKEGVIWWRVEVQLRANTARVFGESLGKISVNPFQNVTPVVDGNFPELDIKQRAMVNYLISYPSGFGELSGKTRKEYKQLIRLIGSWECIDFYDIWEKKYSLVGSEIGSWLNLAVQI